MTPPLEITTALATLDADHAAILSRIAKLRDDSKACFSLSIPTFEALTALYKQRDQLANVRNNLRAYYNEQ